MLRSGALFSTFSPLPFYASQRIFIQLRYKLVASAGSRGLSKGFYHPWKTALCS